LIKNETGGTVHLTLEGPESYEFTLPPGDQTIEVIPGTYEYEGRGCGEGIDSGTKTISESTADWRWWCQ
jgi:hypothetical protein